MPNRVKALLDQKQHLVAIVLTGDVPAVENTELKAEFAIARNIVKLNDEQIQQLQLNALTASFLSASEKLTLRNNVK